MSSGMEGDNEVRAGARTRICLVLGVVSLQEMETQVKEAQHKRSPIVGFRVYEMSRKGSSIETECRLVVTRPGGRGNAGKLLKGYSVSFAGVMKKFGE